MSQVTQALPHLDLETLKQKLKTANSHWLRQKWLVVYTAMVDPRPAKDIAKHIGVSIGFVRQVIQQYNRNGVAGLVTPGKGGRRNCYLSLSQEKQLIESCKSKAVKGHIATDKEIKNAYEEKVGHQVHKTTIYRLLDRHQWHKIVPRPSHPKEDPQAQEEFKKTLPSR